MAWLLLAAIGGLIALHALALVSDPSLFDRYGYDFRAYWLAGQRLSAGLDLYPLTPGARLHWAGVFVYPPTVAVLFVPLGKMPFMVASAAFAGVSLAATAACARTCCQLYRTLRGSAPSRVQWLSAIALIIGSGAWTESLGTGNLTPLLCLLYALFAYGLVTGRAPVAGVSLGVGALLKIFPGALAPAVAGRSGAGCRVAAVGLMAALAIGLTSAAWPAMRDAWLAYPPFLLHLGRGGTAHPQNMAVTAQLEELVGPTSTWIGAGIALAVLGIVVLSSRRMSASGMVLAASAASLLVLPVLWRHSLLLLVPGLVAVWASHPRLHRATGALGIVTTLVSAFTVTWLGPAVVLGAVGVGLATRPAAEARTRATFSVTGR